MDEHVTEVIHHADGSKAKFPVIDAIIQFRENPAFEHEQGMKQVNSVLLKIREPLGFVPLVLHVPPHSVRVKIVYTKGVHFVKLRPGLWSFVRSAPNLVL